MMETILFRLVIQPYYCSKVCIFKTFAFHCILCSYKFIQISTSLVHAYCVFLLFPAAVEVGAE